MKKTLLLPGLLLGLLPGLLWAGETILPGNRLIQYSGRVDLSNPREARFDWSGVALTVRFKGTSIGFLLEDGNNDFDVEVDGRPATVWVTEPDVELYSLSGLSRGEHLVRVTKRTEALYGLTLFKGLVPGPGVKLLPPPPPPARRIEFVGDSITCGYGDEAATLKCDKLRPYENVDKAFGSDTARALGAEAHFVCYSGKGLVRNWGAKGRRSAHPFPPLYGRTLCHDPESRWNFSRWIPDAVVVNLGSNDFSAEPRADPADYVRSYLRLLEVIRTHYPDAAIYCMAPEGWPGFHQWVEEVVKKRNRDGDARVYDVGYPNAPASELGCDYHPNAKAHQQMADVLVPVIQKTLGW